MPRRTIRTRAIALAVVTAGIVALSGCAGASSDSASESGYVTDGKLTIGTAEPAYYPWVIDDKPESGEGFESAVAYAVAGQLGFADSDVVWVRSTFDEAIAPGPEGLRLQPAAVLDHRRAQAGRRLLLAVLRDHADRHHRRDLPRRRRDLDRRPQEVLHRRPDRNHQPRPRWRTSSSPTRQAQVFNSNDDAKLALQNGTVDAIVVDLPTAFYLTGAELDGGKIIGQLPAGRGHDRRPVRPRPRQGQPAHRRASPRPSTPSARTAPSTSWPRSGSAPRTRPRPEVVGRSSTL